MSTEISFKKAKLSTNEHGVFLTLKISYCDIPLVEDFVLKMKEDMKYIARLSKKKDMRSLDQNAYYWHLCNELSEVLKIPPREIYREHIKDVGGNFEIVPIRAEAVKRWVENWEKNGVGFVAEDLGESKIKGYHNIQTFYGSSTYDREEMGRLLDLMKADCDANGISTLTKQEMERLGIDV